MICKLSICGILFISENMKEFIIADKCTLTLSMDHKYISAEASEDSRVLNDSKLVKNHSMLISLNDEHESFIAGRDGNCKLIITERMSETFKAQITIVKNLKSPDITIQPQKVTPYYEAPINHEYMRREIAKRTQGKK